MNTVKLVGNLFYAFLMALVKPAVAAILGAILMKVYPEGALHLIGGVIFWGAVVWAVASELFLAVLIWLKWDEHKFMQRHTRRR